MQVQPEEVIVKCPSCQHENPTGVNFCANCGAALQFFCQSCRTPNQPDSKFCQNCGAALRQTPPQPPPPGPQQPAQTQPPVIVIQQPATRQTIPQQPVVVTQGDDFAEKPLLGKLWALFVRTVVGLAIGYAVSKGIVLLFSFLPSILELYFGLSL